MLERIMFGRINHLAVLAAALLQMLVGALWYSRFAFFTIWAEGIGLDPAVAENPEGWPLRFAFAFVASLVVAYGMAVLVLRLGLRSAAAGLRLGLLIGATLAAATLAVHHSFAHRGPAVIAVDSAMEIVSFALVGLLLAAWPRRGAPGG